MTTKAEVVNAHLPNTLTPKTSASAYAPSNIALSKYWGKREAELNLPINGSLSISLAHLGTHTTLTLADEDCLNLNGEHLSADDAFTRKVFTFIDLFRREQHIPIHVDTQNTIPTAAGLASSASGFAALTLAINDFFCLNLPLTTLSAFARMGSGSASRSVYTGFSEWHKGEQADGMDSHATAIDVTWPDFRIGLVKVDTGKKAVDSRAGMTRTVETAKLYDSWPAQAEQDLNTLRNAVLTQDFKTLGGTAEHNAMAMHATMIASWPPLLYWQPESVAAMQRCWALRADGVPVYFTMDAGPNLKLLFEQQHQTHVLDAFGDIEVIEPFSAEQR